MENIPINHLKATNAEFKGGNNLTKCLKVYLIRLSVE